MLDVRRLASTERGFRANFDALLAGVAETDAAVEDEVRRIIARVRDEGDAALLALTARFDALSAASVEALRVPAQKLEAARSNLGVAERKALEEAAARIRSYHEHQRLSSWSIEEPDGTVLGQRVTPLDRVGLYVPGGTASYPSSVLMNAIPAKVAGVGELVMTVPAPGGELNALVLAAAGIAGVDEVITVGGAQAVAALAFGTESIQPVDKIVGPGNRYVAMAKRLVFGRVGIDMVAGPSEIAVVCDGATPAEWIAMDLFSQAEHDPDARALLLSQDAAFLDAVEAEMVRLLPEMPRRDTIRAALQANGALIQVRALDEAVALVNELAPEHLELSVAQPDALLGKVRHAGAIFLGRHTPEAFGDYCAGPNHVLPTARTARFSSPLGVYDFQKRSSVIACSPRGAGRLARIASVLAHAESLTAHARSAELRDATGAADD